MRYFPTKILVLLILIMPALHFISVHFLETFIEQKYTREIENRYIGDTKPLFNGNVRLREAVSENIDGYLRNKLLIRLGASVEVTVTAGEDTIIYPAPLETGADVIKPPSAEQIAAENYRLMAAGLSVSVDVLLAWNSPLVLMIFFFYLAV